MRCTLLSDLTTSLDSVPEGHEASIVSLLGGHGLSGRLAALGFTPGVTVRVLRNPPRGPIIVNVLDTCIALGRGQARHVLVRQRGR